jgi:DNA-binding Lrp family transcriptional regulator
VKDLVPRHPAIFHWAVAGDQTLLLACERNYTALRDTVDGVQARLTKLGLLGEQPWRFVVLPFARTALSSLFDYGALVGAGPKDGHRPLSLEPPTGSDVSLRRKEAQVLEGLVRYPELSDKALSGRIGVSRQAISRMRQAFEANGLVRTVRVLDLKKLGHEILTVVHATFRPNSPLARRRDEVRFVATRLPQFLLAAGNTESVVLAAMRSYEEYTAIRGELLRFYREQDLLQTEPQIQLLPVADLVHYREVDFGPVLQGYGRP